MAISLKIQMLVKDQIRSMSFYKTREGKYIGALCVIPCDQISKVKENPILELESTISMSEAEMRELGFEGEIEV